MVKTSTIFLVLAQAAPTIANSESAFAGAFEESLSLLQLKALASASPARIVSNTTDKQSRVHDPPGVAERQLCPHEIEKAEPAGDVVFGCQGNLRAVSTVQCSMWGEPHVTATFPSPPSVVERAKHGIDVFFSAGLYRMASAADGTWEVQIFNCGVYQCAMAARLGKDIIEVIVNRNGDLEYYVNGQRSAAGDEVGKISLDSTHRHIVTDHWDGSRRPVDQPGSCIDAPNGQIMIDLVQSKRIGKYRSWSELDNLNVHLVAQSDAVTTMDTDGNSFCNEVAGGDQFPEGWRGTRWESQPIPIDQSLFVSTGNRACEGCARMGWGGHAHGHGDLAAAQNTCSGLQTTEVDATRLDRLCAAQNPPIAVATAQNECRGLAESPDFYYDCQLDYCFSGGNPQEVAESQAEEAVENPQPICVGAAVDSCDPSSACCSALRDGSTLALDNVVQNNMCGTGGGEQELRFGRALTQNGVNMDLVVTPVGDYDCGRLTNEKFGSKNVDIGRLAVQAGTEAEFEFRFVESGTNDPIAPQSLMISMLDLDQGRNGKQRESVTMCGNGGAIVTDDSELAVTSSGDCTTVKSTTHGTGKDNPTSVTGMSQTQRARTAAFPVTGSSFTAKLGVSKKGSNPRPFMFTGHPTVACVLK